MEEEITLDKLKQYIEKVQKTKINDIDMDEFKEFTAKVIEDFNSRNITLDKSGIPLQEHLFLTILAHKYICQVYGNKVSADFLPVEEADTHFFSPKENKVKYVISYSKILQYPFRKIFEVMHENRHAVQDNEYRKNSSEILEIDPLAIAMLKEKYILSYKPELYKNNHSSFIAENDANVCAYAHLKEFIIKYLPNLEKNLRTSC